MLLLVVQAIYLMFPAYAANMAPVLMRKTLPSLDIPVDMGVKFRGHPLFGKNKTVRGFFVGVLFALVMIYIQAGLYWHPLGQSVSLLDYSQINLLLYGFLLGFGALFGDLIKSFFKRQMGIEPGKSWFPWDQLDLVFGALLLLSIVYRPSLEVILIVIVVHPFLHILIKHLGYYLRIENKKW